MSGFYEKLILEEELKNTEQLFEMSTLYRKRTKLPVNIWVDDIGENRNNKHNRPRIKVQNDTSDKSTENLFVVSIDKNPEILAGKCSLSNKDLKEIYKFIQDNYDILMKHWKQEIDTDELKELLYG